MIFYLLINRYKIVVLAGDETEAYNFVLTDRAARRVIGQTATKLIADNLQVCLLFRSSIFWHVYMIRLCS